MTALSLTSVNPTATEPGAASDHHLGRVMAVAGARVTALLQRERTALKLLAQLLSNQRDTLRLGDGCR